MSEELIKTLNAQIKRLNDQDAKKRLQNKGLSARVAELEGKLAEAEKAAGKPDQWKERAEKAEAELLKVRHRDAFAAVVGPRLREKATVEEVWSKAGYTPAGDPPAPEAITELVGKALEAAPYLFREEAQEAETPPGGATQTPATAPPPGSGRGAPGTSSGRFVVTSANLADPIWMRDNQAKVAAAQRDGTLHYTA